MTLQTDINAKVGWFTVEGSGLFPVLSIDESVERVASDQKTGEAMTHRTWTIASFAVAASVAAIPALQTQLSDELARRGQTVRVFDKNGVERAMLEPGAAGSPDAIAGYPRVSLRLIASGSVGPIQNFEVTAETFEPIIQSVEAGFNVVEHTFNTTTTFDEVGVQTFEQRGEARVGAGQSGRSYIAATVVLLQQAIASGNNEVVIQRFEEGPDLTFVRYTITRRQPASGGGGFGEPDVTDGQVIDRTRIERAGRRVRSVSGFAEGAGATNFALAQQPSPASNVLIRQDISQPRVPDGRVTFTYEALTGITGHPLFPLLTVLKFDDSVSPVSGGPQIEAIVYDFALPKLFTGPDQPYIFQQRTSLEFLGDFADAVIPPLAGFENALQREQRFSRQTRDGVKRLDVQTIYIFAQKPAADPMPLEVGEDFS